MKNFNAQLTKQDLLSAIRNDQTFKSVLDAMKDVAQKDQALKQVESLVSNLYDALVPGLMMVASNPSLAESLRKAADSSDGVVMTEAQSVDVQRQDESGHG